MEAIETKPRRQEAKNANATYNETKQVGKRAVWLAKSEAEKDEFTEISENDPQADG